MELWGPQTCKLLSSHHFKPFPQRFFWIRVSLQRLSWLITQRCRTDPRTPHYIGNASCSQVTCTRILALLPSIHVPCVQAMSQVVGVNYMCNRCSGWVHSKCSSLQNAAEYRRTKKWACSSCSSPPTPPIPKPLPSPITTKAFDGDPFTIL